jgi:hypothetical protein
VDDVEQRQDFADPPANHGQRGPGLDHRATAFDLEERKRDSRQGDVMRPARVRAPFEVATNPRAPQARARADRRCRMCFARSSSRRREADSFLPPRLMKYWIIRMAEPSPFGETSLRAIVRAIWAADPMNVRDGGCVESVVTRLTQRFVVRFFVILVGHTRGPYSGLITSRV